MSRASDRAHQQIKALILSGRMPPGAPLREEHLAELCGVSRTPVRDALRRLEGELFVIRSGSQRTYVADWSHEDVDEMFTLRGMLESHAAARAAARINANQLAALKRLNRSLEGALTRPQLDIGKFLESNREFHRIIIEAAQSPRLSATLATLVEQPVVRRTAMTYGREQVERSTREHRELIAAFEAGDPDWAEAVMHAHIRRAYHAFSHAAPALKLASSSPIVYS